MMMNFQPLVHLKKN